VNFLIVGHTHCSIDQYFSVIARAINRSAFIASPLGMEAVWGEAFTNDTKMRKNPKITRKIDAVYDCKAAFKDVRTMKVANHSFPFCFRFNRFHGFARCQYKQFSTPAVWLPKSPPAWRDSAHLNNISVSAGINVRSLDFVGGQLVFLNHLGISNIKDNVDVIRTDSDVIDKLQAFKMVYDSLQNVEAKSLLMMKTQFDDAVIPNPPPQHMVTAMMHELLKKSHNDETAVLVLVKPDACHTVNPTFLNYSDDHSYLDGMPDLTAQLGVDTYADAIMAQLPLVWKSTGKATISAIINSEPPSLGVDVLCFMREKLLYIATHKELMKQQKKRRAETIRNPPEASDPRNVEEEDDEREEDLSTGIDGADMIARTARDMFKTLFNGHIYTWSKTSGAKYHY
jgi:hypothetical protein